MKPPRPPLKKRSSRKNLIAIDGTLDQLGRIRIAAKEVGRNAEPFELRIVHKEALREFVDCNDPDCFNGGFSLGNVVREMAQSRQEEFIGTSFCTGQLGDPEETGPHPSCPTRFEITANLEFRR